MTRLALVAVLVLDAMLLLPVVVILIPFAALEGANSSAAALCTSTTPGATVTAPSTVKTVALPTGATQLLSNDQQTFARVYAGMTGLNAGVVSAWLLNEESGANATARQDDDNNDWLNIGYTDALTVGASDSIWSNPVTAAVASAQWTAGQNSVPGYGTASAAIQTILAYVNNGAGAQIAAIQRSGWASGDESSLAVLYEEVTGTTATGSSDTEADCVAATTSAVPTASGQSAQILSNGEAAAPADASAAVKALIAAGDQIIDKPYIWGGGHSAPLAEIQAGYDCSGTTSYVLYEAGLYKSEMAQVAAAYMSWGDPGVGTQITIYANSTHVFLWVDGIVLDTAHWNPTTPAGSGPRWQPASTVTAELSHSKFAAVHPAGY